jgi:hypothetical protein
MRPEESPFPCRWEGIDFGHQGFSDLRSHVGTYGRYDFFDLPPLPFELRGDWNWLRASEPVKSSIANRRRRGNVRALRSLSDAVTRAGLSLPDSFTAFFSESILAERIRSATCCFLDLGDGGLAAPAFVPGFLVRFLTDQQYCLFWYLYLAPGGDHAVVSSPDFYGSPAEEDGFESGPASRQLEDLSFAAESFEAFLCRFWIENEICFDGLQGKKLSAIGRQYIHEYRKTVTANRTRSG